MDSATFFPVEETEPRFIGARTGHSPIRMHCGTCGYVGTSQVRSATGTTIALFCFMLLGEQCHRPAAMRKSFSNCMRLQYFMVGSSAERDVLAAATGGSGVQLGGWSGPARSASACS